MEKLTYIQCLNNTLVIYGEQGSKAAYEYICEHLDHVADGNKAQLFNFKYCLAEAAGYPEEAFKFLEEAVCEKGYWYDSEYLQEEEDLAQVRKHPEFNRILEIVKEREAAAKATSTATLDLVPATGERLMVAVHGDQENAKMTAHYWKSVQGLSYDLATPQSSQIQFSEAYGWDDLALGLEEFNQHMKTLSQKGYQETVFGGFSAGARLVVESLLAGAVVGKGAILVAPWLPEEENWVPLIPTLAGKGLKFFVMAGTEDVDCFEGAELFVKELEKANIPCVFEKVEGLSHDYPLDFDARLKRALAWIAE